MACVMKKTEVYCEPECSSFACQFSVSLKCFFLHIVDYPSNTNLDDVEIVTVVSFIGKKF